MKKSDLIRLMVFASAVITVIIWVRFNLPFIRPILEMPSFPFQLILAASVIAMLRTVIGIRTIGVFGPTIIALGLTSGGLVWGTLLYIDIFIFAMLATFALYPLALDESHRVAIVITITAIVITILDVLGKIYRLELLESTQFFPVLITSWLADRFVIKVKEIDWVESSKQLLGTIVVVIIAYFVITTKPLVTFIALNPETWAVIILINVITALKADFRLFEFFRFKPILERGTTRTDILSMNRRNQDYIFRYNSIDLFPGVAKDKMKKSLHQLGIPAPETYGIIRSKSDLKYAEKIMQEEQSFVIKPASGSGGEGILVVERKEHTEGIYVAKGRDYSITDLKNHINQILDGQYSSEWGDTAIIEERVKTDPVLSDFYWGGVPDVRIIVFEGFPVMAMTRLPTKESEGLANIHKGAIGMGLSIAEGKGINPYWRGHGGAIERHPDTNVLLTDMKIQNWSKYLEIACMAQAASKLGYAGVDIVPTTRGPLILEVNKRPGLEIQNTNLAGLLKRLEFVERRLPENRFKPLQERIRLSQEWDKRGWK